MKIRHSKVETIYGRNDTLTDKEFDGKYEELRNFEYDVEGMTGFQMVKAFGLGYVIKQALNKIFIDTANKTYRSKRPVAQIKNFHQQILLIGTKGSLERYKQVNKLIPNSWECRGYNEFIYYNEIIAILYDTVVEPELIDKLVLAQQALIARANSGYAEYGVDTKTKRYIGEVLDYINARVTCAQYNWDAYCRDMKNKK